MSNRSYLGSLNQNFVIVMDGFQFPVGMSNRSYSLKVEDVNLDVLPFQFPVGMSNRSYFRTPFFNKIPLGFTFNSPWECRIGLT